MNNLKMSMQPPLTKRRSFLFRWRILAAGLLALGALLAYNLYLDHVHVDTVEREVLSAQARVVDENMASQLDSINRALAGIRNELPRWERLKDGREQATHRLKALSEAMTGVRTMLVLDARGIVTISNREQLIGRDFNQREYFQMPLRDPDPETLYVSPPFRTVLGVFAITVSRAIIGLDGRFAGIVCATLDPEEFEVLINSVRYAPEVWSALAHGDGMLFMMTPERKGVPGLDLAKPGTFFTRHRDSGRQANTMSGIVYATGDERMISLRTIQPPALRMNKPMVVAVARDMDAIFASWRRDAYLQGGLYVSLVLVCVIGLFFYQRRQRDYDLLAASQEEAQRKAAERLKLATEAAGVGVWEYDLASGELVWDDSMFAIYGMDPALFTHVYEAWRNSVLPEDIELAEAVTREAVEQGQPFDSCFRIRRGDGQIRSIRSIARVHHDESGRAVRMVGTNEDITDRKQAEDALRASQASLKALLDNTPYLMWLKDTGSRFVAVNKAFVLSSGKASAAEIIGKTDFDLWPEELAERYRAEDVEVMTTLQQKLVEEQEIHLGQPCWMETFKTPILNQDGQLLGTAGFAQDTSERRERERQRLADAVAHRDTLVREVHHRIKNNLQSVAGLLRLELGKYLEMNPRLETAICQVYAIAAVHGLQSAGPEE
ncbi:MAG: PAS domain-containing protein, partial [Sulfuricella sp.]